MTRIATLLIASLLLVLVPATAEAVVRPALKTQGTTIGTVVTGGNHHTVYVFDLDHQGTRKSACTGACLRAWRPVTFSGTARTHVRAPGITAVVRTIPAGHHRRQLTVDGWPLYYYVADTAAGQFNGRGSGGVWWPVSPDGSRIKVIPVDPPVGTTTPPAGASYAMATRSAAAAVLRTHRSSLGTIVVGAHGRTAYVFDLDHAGTHTSACTGACLRAWTKLTFRGTARSRVAVSGVTGRVGSIPAGTGLRQVTLDGWPLYYFVGDSAAGQVNGQASGGTWWVLRPSGAHVHTTPSGSGW